MTTSKTDENTTATRRSSLLTGSTSDTPRTEIYVLNPQPEAVPAEFARELERELTRVLRQRQDYCDILVKIRQAFRDFDNAREEAQFPGRYRPREKDADDLIENVRQILQNVKSMCGGPKSYEE